MTKVELAELRDGWRARVGEFRASGQTGAAWCEAHQIKEHQLWYWIRKFPVEQSPKESFSNWIPVQIHEPIEVTKTVCLFELGKQSSR